MPTRTVLETCQPRDEVRRGDLREQHFAASLTRVLRHEADPVYGEPANFFQNTYPTGGLKSLLREALGRLTGRHGANAPVIRVETSFGGGKTHNLIGLLHVCRDPAAARAFPDFGFPYLSGAGRLVVKDATYLSGAGRLVVKDAIMMGAALVTMADSAKAYLRKRAASLTPFDGVMLC